MAACKSPLGINTVGNLSVLPAPSWSLSVALPESYFSGTTHLAYPGNSLHFSYLNLIFINSHNKYLLSTCYMLGNLPSKELADWPTGYSASSFYQVLLWYRHTHPLQYSPWLLSPWSSRVKYLWWPWPVAQLAGASSCTPKGCWFDSRSEHITRLQVWSPVRACTGGNRWMFLSHIDVSISLFLPSSLSLCLKITLKIF